MKYHAQPANPLLQQHRQLVAKAKYKISSRNTNFQHECYALAVAV